MHVLAYIDPGAGSLIIQAMVAAALSVPFFFRRTLSQTVARLRGEKAETGTTAEPSVDDPAD